MKTIITWNKFPENKPPFPAVFDIYDVLIKTKNGKIEMTMLQWNGEDWRIDQTEPIEENVIGWAYFNNFVHEL